MGNTGALYRQVYMQMTAEWRVDRSASLCLGPVIQLTTTEEFTEL